MRKIISLLLSFLLITSPVFSAEYFVRPDGGTPTQCTGLADSAYDGSGTGEACGLSHPNYVLAPQGWNPSLMVGGDIMTVTPAEYMFGYGSPNTADTSKCHQSWTWDCYTRQIPAGSDADHRTIIRGKDYANCTSMPQFWGTERLAQIFITNDFVELNCLELTDHEDCGYGGTSNNNCPRTGYPKGEHADYALTGNGTGVLLKNLNIHGMGVGGTAIGALTDLTVDNVVLRGNSNGGMNFAGPNGNYGSNNGDMIFNELHISYSGCQEEYPATGSESDIKNCCDQNQNPPCYGDGLGTPATGGNWRFTYSSFIGNAEDGLDLLYVNEEGEVEVYRITSMHNSGNQIKLSSNSHIEDSKIIGDCTYLDEENLVNGSWGGNCRAGGDIIALSLQIPGQQMKLINNTIGGNGNYLVYLKHQVWIPDDLCNGTENLLSINNIFFGSDLFSGSGDTGLFGGDNRGTCGFINPDYGTVNSNIVYNVAAGSNPCNSSDPGVICPNVDPELSGITISSGGGFTCDDTNCDVALDPTSPGIDAGEVNGDGDYLDLLGLDRGVTWDIGAEEFNGDPADCSTNCALCPDETACESSSAFNCSGGFCCWDGDSCGNTPPPSCDIDHCSLCSTQTPCETAGCYWYNSMCNVDPEVEDRTSTRVMGAGCKIVGRGVKYVIE